MILTPIAAIAWLVCFYIAVGACFFTFARLMWRDRLNDAVHQLSKNPRARGIPEESLYTLVVAVFILIWPRHMIYALRRIVSR